MRSDNGSRAERRDDFGSGRRPAEWPAKTGIAQTPSTNLHPLFAEKEDHGDRATTAGEIGEQSAGKLLRPFGSMAAYEDAQREVNAWFSSEWQKLTAEKQAREREIERKFWNGDYSR